MCSASIKDIVNKHNLHWWMCRNQFVYSFSTLDWRQHRVWSASITPIIILDNAKHSMCTNMTRYYCEQLKLKPHSIRWCVFHSFTEPQSSLNNKNIDWVLRHREKNNNERLENGCVLWIRTLCLMMRVVTWNVPQWFKMNWPACMAPSCLSIKSSMQRHQSRLIV